MNKFNVLSLLEESASKYPERIVFKDKDEEISYSNLKTVASRTGLWIRERAGLCDGEKNKPVAVFVDRNIKSLLLFMSVVYSGNFYVPIDATLPKQRIDLIIETLNPVLMLSATKRKLTVENVIPFSETPAGSKNYDEQESLLEEEVLALKKVRRTGIDTDPLYAIFTSGTTGVPKGVLVAHRSVLDLVNRFTEVFPFPEYPIFGNQAPFDFDVSVKDIYNALFMGGTVVVIPKAYFVMPSSLLPYLKENKVNTLVWAVSALRIVQNFKLFEACIPDDLKLIMFSGEVMPIKCLKYLKEYLPQVTYVNLYGPTEITCNCNYYIVDREFEDTQNLPLGEAFENSEVFLQDTETLKRITEPEKLGEICVKGTCLALGYYNNPEQTAKAFVQDPDVSAYQDLIYKTGDLGKYDEEGNLYYVSRKDFQIKHMGHRIELSEIEVVVNALDEVHMACCTYKESEELISLYYSSQSECDALVRSAIKEKLPAFMMPGKIQWMEALPLNEHAKIDRRKLAAL